MGTMTLIEQVKAWKLPSPEMRRAIRRASAVTQVRMAAELGVHRVTFARWKAGELEPRGDNRAHYARLLEQLQRVSS